jgi:hypothetical protein
MPLTIKRTNITSIAANSVQFNGSNQYLTAAPGSSFLFGTSPFTIEMWLYPTVSSTNTGIFDTRNTSNSSTGILIRQGDNISNGGVIYVLMGSGLSQSVYGNILLNYWSHVAFVRNSSGSGSLYINGTSVSTANMNANVTDTNFLLSGFVDIKSSPYGYTGYISNVRVVNGTAVYTSNFTPPTSPLTAIANTSLLTCNAPTIVDSSTNNFTITNNGAATVSSLSPTFRASTNNFQFARRTPTLAGNSVSFNGSTQYLSIPGNAAFAFGTGNFTIEWWQYMTSQPSNPRVFSIGNYSSATIGVSIEGGTFYVWENSGARFNYSLTVDGYLNRWLHFAISRNNGTTSIFKNGIQIGSSYSDTNNINNTSTALSIGQESTPTANSYFPGYISNFRIVNGTAVYTSSFTPPTSPLTAIANTSLLTCNADTIVDSSTNNFTITNNNSATVSSVSPFVASGGGMSLKKVYADPVVVYLTQKAIFGFGVTSANNFTAVTNIVSNTGVVATDTTGIGTSRTLLAAAGYGGDKAIFAYGFTTPNTNLVSNTGVVSTDAGNVGTSRYGVAASVYGGDKAIFGFGSSGTSVINLVSNTGVVATDTGGVGKQRFYLAAVGYGQDKAIFGYGYDGSSYSITNLVSNTGVVSTDTTGVGTARYALAAARYSNDKAIFGYGRKLITPYYLNLTNLVSNTGVVATDVTGIGTTRQDLAAAAYGQDKAIFGYGTTNGSQAAGISTTNLVSNTGVVATDTTGVGTTRSGLAAAGFSLT